MKLSGVPEPYIDFAPSDYICHKTSKELILDGNLQKEFWEDAPWSEEFVDIEGDIRPKPNKSTRFKMLWDDEYLYFGAKLEEDEIWATLTERDSVIFHDNDFEIFIDPDGDTHNYYEFEINALNTIWDLFLPQPYRDNGKPVNSWDIRDIKTAIHIQGELNNPEAHNLYWSVEVAMPWKVLRECAFESRKPKHGEYWRVNFSRVQWKTEVKAGKYRKLINSETNAPYAEDNWVWSPTGVINMHYPELWGFVVFSEQGDIDFEIPEDEIIKWQLRKLYYRQRNYYEKHGSFCGDFNQLSQGDNFTINPDIEITSSMFQISTLSKDKKYRICIRQDGKVWRE